MSEVVDQATVTVSGAERTTKPRGQLVLLGGLMALGPLSVDMYLPALPGIRSELNATPVAIQLTITGVMIGMGVGQVVIGPLSDAVGRRRPLIGGLIAYVVGSLLCVLAPNATLLVTARIIQGLAIAAAGVIATATVRDLFSGSALAGALGRLMIIPLAAPVIAPTIGGALLTWAPWRGVFVLLAVCGVLMLITTVVVGRQQADHQHSVPSAGWDFRSIGSQSVAAYWLLLRDRQFLAPAAIIGATMAALLGYVAGAPFVLQGTYGLDQHQFALVFGAGGISLIVAGRLNAYLLRRSSPQLILRAAAMVGVAAGVWLIVAGVTRLGGLPGLLVGVWLMLGVIGIVFPNAPAIALSRHGDRAGSAAALIGFIQFGVGAVGAPSVGLLGNTPVAMAVVCAAGMLIAAVTAIAARFDS